MTEKIWKIPTSIIGLCEDCAFYNDCPAEYMCPAAEIIADAIIEMSHVKDGRE